MLGLERFNPWRRNRSVEPDEPVGHGGGGMEAPKEPENRLPTLGESINAIFEEDEDIGYFAYPDRGSDLSDQDGLYALHVADPGVAKIQAILETKGFKRSGDDETSSTFGNDNEYTLTPNDPAKVSRGKYAGQREWMFRITFSRPDKK